ncbi:MAG: hypothetical protein R3A10_22025 [Caldilineaceae bacterium]
MIDAGLLTDADLTALEQRVADEIQEAIAYAQASPDPDPASIMEESTHEPQIDLCRSRARAMDIAAGARPRVFLFGEDVGVYGGAFGVSDGLFQSTGRNGVLTTPISEAVVAKGGRRLVHDRHAPHRRNPVHGLHHPVHGTTGAQAAKLRFMLGGKDGGALRPARPRSAGTGSNSATLGEPGELVRPRARHQGGHALVAGRRQGAAPEAIEDPNPVIFVEHKLLYRTKGPVPEGYAHALSKRSS